MEIGAKFKVAIKVEEKDTAMSYGSGTLAVLATPRMIALMEESAYKCIDKYLEEGQTIPELMNTCVSTNLEIDCWIEYRIDDNGREYDNYYWDEDKYNVTKVLNTANANNTISLGNVSKEDLMNMESLPL